MGPRAFCDRFDRVLKRQRLVVVFAFILSFKRLLAFSILTGAHTPSDNIQCVVQPMT